MTTLTFTPMSWRPILPTPLQEEARDVVEAIARDLPLHAPPVADGILFYSYVEVRDAESRTYGDRLLEELVDAMSAGTIGGGVGLHSGATKIAWLVSTLIDGAEDFLAAFDKALLSSLSPDKDWRSYDLINGLVGVGVYLLSRPQTPITIACFEAITDRLRRSAESLSSPALGLAWRTPIQDMPEHDGKLYPDGYFNCGLAHGNPGVLALLARFRGEGIDCGDLLSGACDFVTSMSASVRFPRLLYRSQVIESLRSAWCYGAPGAAIALWQALNARGLPTNAAEELALRFLSESPTTADVGDAMFCHGTAGLAHISNRFYQATLDERFKELSIEWFRETLARRRSGEGVGGFLAQSVSVRPAINPSFVDGSIGLGLSLAAAIGSMEPSWDALLLCDLPTRHWDGGPDEGP